MKMAESIVCLRLWHDQFSPRYRKAAPTFWWQSLHIVVPKCKVLCYHTTNPFLGLTDKHNASSSKSFDFFQRSNPYCFTRIWDFSCRFALPCVCQDTENDRKNSKNGMKTLPEATIHQTFGPQSSELSTPNIGTLSPRSPMFLNSQLGKPAQST